jgi:hypothetical protein
VETSNRIMEQIRVMLERSGYPGMGQLQQRRPAGSKKDSRLAVHLPGDRFRAEKTGTRVSG